MPVNFFINSAVKLWNANAINAAKKTSVKFLRKVKFLLYLLSFI